MQGVQNNNLQLSINKVLAEVQCPFMGITFQKRDKATGEIQRKTKRLIKGLENSKGKTENFPVFNTLFVFMF